MHILAIAALLESKGETPFDIARAGEGLNKNSFLNYHLSIVSFTTHSRYIASRWFKQKKKKRTVIRSSPNKCDRYLNFVVKFLAGGDLSGLIFFFFLFIFRLVSVIKHIHHNTIKILITFVNPFASSSPLSLSLS